MSNEEVVVRVFRDDEQVNVVPCRSVDAARRLIEDWEHGELLRFEIEPAPADDLNLDDGEDTYPHR